MDTLTSVIFLIMYIAMYLFIKVSKRRDKNLEILVDEHKKKFELTLAMIDLKLEAYKEEHEKFIKLMEKAPAAFVESFKEQLKNVIIEDVRNVPKTKEKINDTFTSNN